MRFITFSGPPSSGKSSVIINTIKNLKKDGIKVGVVKFDCLYTCLLYTSPSPRD